jgi:death-on-curing protein
VNVEWIALETVLIYHDRQITEHGGAEGVRDEGALESVASSAAEPSRLWCSGSVRAGRRLCKGHLVQNHPFVDGNKRTAFVVAASFLDLNGQELTAPEAEAALLLLRLAAGKVGEAELAEWFRRSCTPSDTTFLVAEQDP